MTSLPNALKDWKVWLFISVVVFVFGVVGGLEPASVLPPGSVEGFSHQFSFVQSVDTPFPCSHPEGCRLPSAEGSIFESGSYKLAFKSEASGATPCAVYSADGVQNVECPTDVIITDSSTQGSFKLNPQEFKQINEWLNITYIPTFGYVTVVEKNPGGPAPGAAGVSSGEIKGKTSYTYIVTAQYVFLVGFDVEKFLRMSDDPTNNVVVQFKKDSVQSVLVGSVLGSARGLDARVGSVDSSDVEFRGTRYVENVISGFGTEAVQAKVSVPTTEIGLRKVDHYPFIKIGVKGDNPKTLGLQSIFGIRHVYDVLPSGASASGSRARTATLLFNPQFGRVLEVQTQTSINAAQPREVVQPSFAKALLLQPVMWIVVVTLAVALLLFFI